MIRVVHITTVHQPFDTRIFHKEAKTLVKAGYEVILIVQHERNQVVDGVKIIALHKPRNRLQRIFGITWQAFRLALKQKAAIYHFHDPELIPTGIMLKFLTGAQVVYDMHEDYPQHMLFKTWLPVHLRRLISRIIWHFETIAARHLDAIVTPTKALTKRFERRRAITAHNFPILDNDIEIHNESSSLMQFDIIHVGTLSFLRLSFMFFVAQELQRMGYNFKWCIIGASNEIIVWAESEMERKHHNICDNFVFKTWVSHSEVKDYLRQSKIGINHHPFEDRFMVAIPVKIFEYLASGLPVVSSDLPLLRELIGEEGCAILVKPEDVQVFANAIGYLLDNPAVSKNMGDRGKKVVRKKYNWGIESAKLIRLYRELLGAK